MKKLGAVAVIIIIAVLLLGTVKPEKETLWQEYRVRPGDTLYKIALECAGNGEDYRDLVYYIIEINGIKNSMIYPGQVLLVPVKNMQ